jgi:hypothetical protein
MTSTLIWRETSANITFVVGVPGAGKTTYAKKLIEQDPAYVLIDDPKTRPNFEPTCKYLVTDPKLCYRTAFDTVNTQYPSSHWVFFKTDPFICWQNVQKRLENEPYKVVSLQSFIRFVREFESNFLYYLESVSTYQIEELKNGLV